MIENLQPILDSGTLSSQGVIHGDIVATSQVDGLQMGAAVDDGREASVGEPVAEELQRT